jgi:L-serine dehydratase
VAGLRVTLYGSLAHTGVGHATDRAAILGLAGFRPDTFDAERAESVMTEINVNKTVTVPFLTRAVKLDPKTDVVFDYGQPLPGHANGMVVQALDATQDVLLQVRAGWMPLRMSSCR